MTIAGIASILLLTASTSAAVPVTAAQAGKVFTHEAAGVRFQLPAGWTSEPDDEQITISSPDDAFTVVFWALDADSLEAAMDALDEELGKIVSKVKGSGEPKKGTHNGMTHVSLEGTGEVEGVAVHWSVDLLVAKKPVVILTFAASEGVEKHAAAYAKMVQSIQKIK